MSIFTFAKDAGKKKRAADEASLAAAIEKEMGQLGLLKGVENFSLSVANGAATLRGIVPTQTQREKMVIMTGNIFSVSAVHDELTLAPPAPAPVEAIAAPTTPARPLRAARAETVSVPEATAENPSRFYEVRKGDTLSAIAKAMYGKASQYPVIFEANKPMLKHPDKIFPGQVLRIPPLD